MRSGSLPFDQPHHDNNMTMPMVAIFLCWPLAIPAILNASEVNNLLKQGELASAAQAAAESRE